MGRRSLNAGALLFNVWSCYPPLLSFSLLRVKYIFQACLCMHMTYICVKQRSECTYSCNCSRVCVRFMLIVEGDTVALFNNFDRSRRSLETNFAEPTYCSSLLSFSTTKVVYKHALLCTHLHTRKWKRARVDQCYTHVASDYGQIPRAAATIWFSKIVGVTLPCSRLQQQLDAATPTIRLVVPTWTVTCHDLYLQRLLTTRIFC